MPEHRWECVGQWTLKGDWIVCPACGARYRFTSERWIEVQRERLIELMGQAAAVRGTLETQWRITNEGEGDCPERGR